MRPKPLSPAESHSRSLLEMRLVIQFWKRERARLALIVLLTAIGVALSLAFPFILRYIVDGIQQGLTRPQDFAPRQLLNYVLLLLGFGVLRAVMSVTLPYTRGRSNEVFMWQTRNMVFRRMLDMGHSFSNRFPAGDVLERLDHDLNDLSWFACSGIFRPVEAIFTLGFALIILLRMNWLLTIVAVLPISLGVLAWLRLGPLVAKWYREWRERISETNNHLEASFSGIRLVKAYTMEARSGRNFRRVLDERVRAALRSVRAEALIGIMFNGISELGILLILGFGGILVIRGALTLGEFVAFNAYILMLITPMFDIGNFFVAGKRAQAGEERIRALYDFPPDVDLTTGRRRPPSVVEVFLTNVGFSYGSSPKAETVGARTSALQDINMAIIPGAKIGIAGTVGSGKSTLMRLLLRLAEPAVGEVTLNGVPLREFEAQAVRELYGYAPQEASLFSDTIYNNITLGREVRPAQGPESAARTRGLTDERVAEVARIAQLESDVKVMPNGLQETIGERGVKLSGGQKGRVSIARALFARPRILLLDDVTASLDAETEQQFIRDVLGYVKEATLVIVSHRLSILAACDIVFVLDAGRIVESGTHAELLERRGLYWQLYERQIMQDELELA